MRILLIMPYHCDMIHAVSLPLGIMSIGSYLEQHGHTVEICDAAVERVNVSRVFDRFKPDIIGLSFPSAKSVNGIFNISKKLRGKGVPIVWGGPFCDISEPAILLGSGVVDYLCFSEGEATWLEIADRMQQGRDFKDIRGIAYLDGDGSVVRTPDRPFLRGDELPEMDWSLVDVRKYYQYLYGCRRLVYVYLSKGCPAHCTFCINDLSHRCMRRSRPLDMFMREIRSLVRDYDVDGIYFSDELCFPDRKTLDAVCDAFDRDVPGLLWGFQTRIGCLDRDGLQRAYDSGCRWIDFGVESGNREMLETIKKRIPYDKIEPTFRDCTDIGIISLANFIVGLPNETEEQIRDTVNLALRIDSTQVTVLKYCFSPATQLGKMVIQSGVDYPHVYKLMDYKKLDFFLNREMNVSKVNNRDINVIQSYFLWKAIFRKDYKADARSYDLLLKSLWTAFNRFMKMDLITGCEALFEIAYLFLRFFTDVALYKKIRKKYSLV